MKCPACGWTNPDSYDECFSCHLPLSHQAAKPMPVSSIPIATSQRKTSQPAQPAPQKRRVRRPASPAKNSVLANTGSRLLATVIDLITMLIPGLILLLIALHYDQQELGFSMSLLLATLCLLVPAFLDTWSKGSLGKRVAQIRVINSQGQRPGLWASILRHIGKYSGHFILPFALYFLDHLIFGGRSLHNVLTQNYVVNHSASPEDLQALMGKPQDRWIGNIIMSIVGGALLLFITLIAWLLLSPSTPLTPKQAAVKAVQEQVEPMCQLVENYYLNNGAFPTTPAQAGIDPMPEGIQSIEIHPESGAIIVAANQPLIQGKRIVLNPVFKTNRHGETQLKRWRCGSPDLPPADLPAVCDDKVVLPAQKASQAQ